VASGDSLELCQDSPIAQVDTMNLDMLIIACGIFTLLKTRKISKLSKKGIFNETRGKLRVVSADPGFHL
jgi:hypothetical protein